MKTILSVLLIALTCVCQLSAKSFTNETVNYRVEYKWGLVNKTAGNVRIRLSSTPDRYSSILTASSAKWADKFYRVRDTLKCEIIKEGFKPVFYEKNSHEGDDDKHDRVDYIHKTNKIVGQCVRKKWKDGKLERDETRVLEAVGTTMDMLSSFYYMRALPYASWEKGHVHSINIFSGKRKELLTIKYLGREKVEYDKHTYDCHHIRFIFTSDGKKKTSDDMDAWIDVTGNNIPIKLEGKLPVGKIRCFYTGAN